METIAILAAFNLENKIQEIVKRTQNYVDLVIVVTDGSNDNTHVMASQIGALCPPHTYVRGKGFAIRKGIEFSKRFNTKYIVLLDADGQHLPEEIPNIINPLINHNAGMVIGSRMKGKLRTSTINKIGNIGLKIISFVVTGKWITDTESGFRALKAKDLYNLTLEAMSYDIESDFLLKALHNNLKIIEVPITVPTSVPGVTVKDGFKIGLFKIKVGLRLKIKGG
ncbi:MAG: glycosyltransferase family 2 protein [Actinobacteria bacterium]|nr:glycosyltransferase family 2 protein [Actinomycetota bacterium]